MATSRKYAALPDLDTAPDIYETPELTDDNSTVPTTAPTYGEAGFDDSEDDDEEGISRSRVNVDEARARFLPANVDANGADFSDRVDGKRKSYKTSSRRQRLLQDGTTELGDLSDDDDSESLERRIARLKREVQEAQDDLARRIADSDAKDDPADADGRLRSLSQVLNNLSTHPAMVTSLDQRSSPPAHGNTNTSNTIGEHATYTVTYAPEYEQTHALAKAAAFDTRLLMLEKSLGLHVDSTPGIDSAGLPRAILPMLDNMDKQISTLAQASTANLDAVSRRIRALATEQEKLNEAKEKAKTLREELGKQGNPQADEPEQEAKINALYGTLPTIENLAPILPPLLDRLRSLRAIHSDAATASETLSRIEKEQVDMASELQQWKTGLEKLEEAVETGGESIEGNMQTMQGWIKDLEARMAKLQS